MKSAPVLITLKILQNRILLLEDAYFVQKNITWTESWSNYPFSKKLLRKVICSYIASAIACMICKDLTVDI